jgi:hypothetical protein
MGDLPTDDVRAEREGLFSRLVDAYMARDFDALREVMRPDIVFDLPGRSRVAGVHRGVEDVGRSLVYLRQMLRPASEEPISFEHGPDRITVRYQALVEGPMHRVEMVVRILMIFDSEGKVATVEATPDDLGLFDHVLETVLGDHSPD